MAGAIKGITIEFGADVTNLNNALKKTKSALSATQQEIRSIDRALKFNPGSTTLLKQKFDLLKRAVGETETKLKQLKDMQKKMDANNVDKTSAQYKQLEREIERTEQELQKAQNDLKRFGSIGKQQALAVGNAFKTAGGKIKSAGRTITTSVSMYGVAGVYAGAKLIDMSNKQAQAEQKLQEIYKTRMGVNKAAAQSTMELASALQQQGVVGDEVALSFAQQMATYSSVPGTVDTLMPAFENLLVQQKGLNGTQEDAVGLANMFGKAMMGQTGALKRAGISFTDAQAEVLKYGTEEEKAAMMAEVITQNVGNMNSEFAKTDAGKIQQAKNQLGDMGEEIGAILLPAVADLVSWMQDNLLPKFEKLIGFLQQHPAIAKFALAFAAITAVLGPVIMIIGSLISAIGGIISIAAVLGPIIGGLSLPILGIVAAIAAAIAIGIALYKNWDTIKKKAKAIWTAIKKAVFNLVQSMVRSVVVKLQALKTGMSNIWNGIKNAASRVWNNIKTAITHPIQTAKNKVKGIIEKIKGFFPLKLKKIVSFQLPKIKVGSKSTKVGDKNVKSPTFGVSAWQRYAKAARTPYMFNRPTGIVVGDAKQNEIVYGRNSLMRDIAQAVGANSGMVVNVYGSDNMSVNDLAQAVEQRIITMQKRRTQAWA